jgi:uncharacterized membrane protein
MTSEQCMHQRGGERQTQQDERRGTSNQSARHVPRIDGRGRLTQEQRLADGLAWFGIGLGLAEVLAPRRVAAMIGVGPEHQTLIRLMGVRELASSAGIFSDRSSAGALWSRVAGDVLDLALLGTAFASTRSNPTKLAAATASVTGALLLDVITAQQLSRGIETRHGTIRTSAAVIIDCPQEPLYRYWRQLTNLRKFMKHVERIEMSDDRRSHWVAKGPVGSVIEWDAELTEDLPNELIAWRSVDDSKLDHAGSVRFEPALGGRGTMVTVAMQYRPPLGTVGAAVAAWFGADPNQTVKMDLRRFKQIMETGEVITTQGQPAGREESTSSKYDHAVR